MTDSIKIHDKFKNDAVATLVQLCRDESAPAASRATAATKILEYAVGRPPQAKPITVHDVAGMDEETRAELWHALFTHYQNEIPEQFNALLREAVNEAVQQEATTKRPTKMRRGAAVPLPPHIPQPQHPARSLRRETGPPAIAHSSPEHVHGCPLQPVSQATPPPDPAITMTSTKGAERPTRIGDVPIDVNVTDYLKTNGYANGNGHLSNGAGPDYAKTFRDYNAAANRHRNGR